MRTVSYVATVGAVVLSVAGCQAVNESRMKQEAETSASASADAAVEESGDDKASTKFLQSVESDLLPERLHGQLGYGSGVLFNGMNASASVAPESLGVTQLQLAFQCKGTGKVRVHVRPDADSQDVWKRVVDCAGDSQPILMRLKVDEGEVPKFTCETVDQLSAEYSYAFLPLVYA